MTDKNGVRFTWGNPTYFKCDSTAHFVDQNIATEAGSFPCLCGGFTIRVDHPSKRETRWLDVVGAEPAHIQA